MVLPRRSDEPDDSDELRESRLVQEERRMGDSEHDRPTQRVLL